MLATTSWDRQDGFSILCRNKIDPLNVPEKRHIAVVIIVHQERVLVGKRASDAATAKGFHEFPGGKIETGESASRAAVRECLEETGLHICIDRQLDRTLTDEEHFEIIFFLGSLESCANPEPCKPFKWLSRTELDMCTFPAANRSVVNWLRDSLPAFQGGS
jgi:8-oxo-dGTP diphosphatase